MKKWIFLIIGILGSMQLSAQDMEIAVRAMFDDASQVKWIEHYRGRLSDINDVAMTLGYDGTTCKGVMWYLRSNARFQLKGEIVGDTALQLIEYDSMGLATGRVEGILEEYDGFKGSWLTLDKSLGENMEMLPSASEPRYPGYCGDNKWVHKYTGTIGDSNVEMILRRGNNGYVKGTVYYKDENRTYYAEGELFNRERAIFLEIKDVNWNEKAVITANVNFSSDRISGSAIVNGAETTCDLPLFEKLAVGCIEYADFLTKTEITYPKTLNEDFNENIREQVEEWSALARTYTTEYKGTQTVLTASQRLSLRSYCWYEIDCFNSRIISGKIIQTNTWDNDYQGFSFNYDLIENKPITLDDLFNEGFDYSSFIKHYINTEIKKRPFYGDGYYEVWIKTQQFEYFTFRREGLVFSTNFNGIYGEQQVTIPYEVIKEYLKDVKIVDFVN